MTDELLPKKSYTALELAALNLPGMPTTKKGWYALLMRENWEVVTTVEGGRGNKSGIKRTFVPPDNIQAIIDVLNESSDYLIHEKKVMQQRAPYSNHKLTGDTIYIEHYSDVRAAAGNGQVTPTDQTIIQVAVNASEWRSYVGLNHKNLKIITIYGDSMRPTFSHGDQVLVDTACHSFIDDGVYAIQQGDLLRVKRIKLRLDGSVEVKSDNSQGFSTDTYSSDEAAEFHIYGRVIPFKFGKIEL